MTARLRSTPMSDTTSDDDRAARLTAVAEHVARNSRELYERLAAE